ncbi:MAG TPA: flagellar filament capping protein FliD [Firmicutes bacterium]|nr:flagellar filament capping protein FliD [Bacillota bacterium]
MSVIRIGGIASGLDTEQIIKDLMRIEKMKADKLYQQRQIVEWQKSQFREIINEIRIFRDNFFNVLKPETNITSLAALKKLTVTTSRPDCLTAIANADALVGESTFQILGRAAAAKAVADGITRDSGEGSRLAFEDTMETVSGKLKENLDFNEDGNFSIRINGTEISIAKTDTLRQVINKINNSGAAVQVHYSVFSDTFSITARETGAGRITVEDGGNFFQALGFAPDEAGNIGEAGSDAHFAINGFEGTHSSNSFTIDGISYTILEQAEIPSEVITVKTGVDVDGIFNVIESFINGYNDLLDKINSKLLEKRFRDFPPLTDEQKEAMKDTDIEKWEEKAQSGLLRGEPTLENMLARMRQALYDMVGEYHLTEFGIRTGNDYRERGKLVLSDGGSKLKQAIAGAPQKLAEIFTRTSSFAYSPDLSPDDRAKRYAESGIAHRVSDILNDYIRTTRDNRGVKGILLEKAGLEGDITEFNNFYDRRIKTIDQQLFRVNELLIRREEQYYRRFAAMEKALEQLYSQGDWLLAQLNSFYAK